MKKKSVEKKHGGIFLRITPAWFQHLEYVLLITALGYIAALTESIFVLVFVTISWLLYIFYLTDLIWKKFTFNTKNRILVHFFLIPVILILGALIITGILAQVSPNSVPNIFEILTGTILPWTIE